MHGPNMHLVTSKTSHHYDDGGRVCSAMTETGSRNRLLAKTPVRFSSSASGSLSDRLCHGRLRRRRRRRRSLNLFLFDTDRGGDSRIESIPDTPLLHWKFNEDGPRFGETQLELGDKTLRKARIPAGGRRPSASARNLAAQIWNTRFPKVVCGNEVNLDLQTSGNCFNLHLDANERFKCLCAARKRRNAVCTKLETAASLLPSSREKTTNSISSYQNGPKIALNLYDNLNLHEEETADLFSIVPGLRSELELARFKVNELEAERQCAKKELDHFIRKFEEERVVWRRREHEQIRSINAMKEDLKRERKAARRFQVMNAKLISELTEVKQSSEQYLLEYEKERKNSELLEEICNELATEIGNDKALVEALKIESVRAREEMEEERKMLQMAEVWREERVQMKLIDAKLTLEERYSKLIKLQEEIEDFLRSRSGNNDNAVDTKHAKTLKEAIESIKTQGMIEFLYQTPPSPDGLFSLFEDKQSRKQISAREIAQSYHSVTPVANGFSEKTMKRYDNVMFDGNCDVDDDSGWETVSCVEEQESCKSPDGSEPSVNGAYAESQASVSGTDYDEHRDDKKLNSEISEVCSATTRLSRKKGSLSWLWKTSRATDGEGLKKIAFELTNGRLCSGKSLSPAQNSTETGLNSLGVCNWTSPDWLNSHITNEKKGRVKWPHSAVQQSLKAKLMEARIQNQRVQLRHVLKQKI